MANGYVKEMPYRWRSLVIDGLVDGWCFERLREGLRKAGMPEEQLPTDKNLRTYRDGDEEYKEVCRHLRFQQAARHVPGGMAADSAALDAYAESLLLRETSLRVMDGSFGPAELYKGMNAVTRMSRTRFQRRVAEATCARQDRAEATARELGLTGGALGGGRPLAGGRASGGMATREQLFAARAEGEAALWLDGVEALMEGVACVRLGGLNGMPVAARRTLGSALEPLANLLERRRGAVEGAIPAETGAAVDASLVGFVGLIRSLSLTGELPGEAAAWATGDVDEDEEVADEARADAGADSRDGDAEPGADWDDADAGRVGSLAWFMAEDDGEEESANELSAWDWGSQGRETVVYTECKADDEAVDASGLVAPWHREASGREERAIADGVNAPGECRSKADGDGRMAAVGGAEARSGGPSSTGPAAEGGDASTLGGAGAVRRGGGGDVGDAAQGEKDGLESRGRSTWKVPPFLVGPRVGPMPEMLVLMDAPLGGQSQERSQGQSQGQSQEPSQEPSQERSQERLQGQSQGRPQQVAGAGAAGKPTPMPTPLEVDKAAVAVEAELMARRLAQGCGSPGYVLPGEPLGAEAEFLASITRHGERSTSPETQRLLREYYRCLASMDKGNVTAKLERMMELLRALDMAHLIEPLFSTFRVTGLSRLLPKSARFCPILPDPNAPPPGVSQEAWLSTRTRFREGMEAELVRTERSGKGKRKRKGKGK